jgi:uncharacterized protein (TIGR02421 family)
MSLTETLPDAVAEADRRITAIASELDVLLEVTPVNAETEWDRWQSERHEPRFAYRRLTFDPVDIQRRVARIDLDGVQDTSLHHLLSAKTRDLHLQAELVLRRDTPGFVETSLDLHGGCDDELLELAMDLLDNLVSSPPVDEPASPEEFAERSKVEIDRYRASLPSFQGTVHLRSDIPSLMVVGRELYVGTDSWIPRHRVEALVHHEVGTHLLTAETGGHQPLSMMEHGTAGYEETQEALGVLSEHLVGGLDPDRMRTLAGRAVAVRLLTDGAGFNEVVEALLASGFAERPAWTITMRVMRGGGYTKDVIYLRGLVQLVDHLERHPIEPLLTGKMHLSDIPTVTELLGAGVLQPPAVRPHWLDEPGAQERLDGLGRTPIAGWLDL